MCKGMEPHHAHTIFSVYNCHVFTSNKLLHTNLGTSQVHYLHNIDIQISPIAQQTYIYNIDIFKVYRFLEHAGWGLDPPVWLYHPKSLGPSFNLEVNISHFLNHSKPFYSWKKSDIGQLKKIKNIFLWVALGCGPFSCTSARISRASCHWSAFSQAAMVALPGQRSLQGAIRTIIEPYIL